MLILSATVGDLEGFCNQLRSVLEGVGVEDVQYIIANFDRSRQVGTRYVYIVHLDDDREAESLVRDIVLELVRRAITQHGASLNRIEKTLIFVPNRNIAERLCRNLQNEAYRLCRDHGLDHEVCARLRQAIDRHLGDMALWERERVEKEFKDKDGNIRILFTVKTLEVGIDIGDVQRVVHWGLPSSLNDFIQREGRAGRRPGEYESIVIVISERERQLVSQYVQVLQDPILASQQMYTPAINPEAALVRRLRRDVSALGRMPDYIEIPPDIRWPVRFYFQDSRTFRVVDLDTRRTLREIRIEDVLYRYLPGMMRLIGGTMYVVESIDLNKGTVYVRQTMAQVTSRTQSQSAQSMNALHLVWSNHVTDPNFCLNIRYVLSGRIFTTSDILVFISERETGYVSILLKPLGTKLVRLDYEEEVVRLPDGRVVMRVVPIFKLCGYLPVDQKLSEQLSSRIVTRGIVININLRDLPSLSGLVSEYVQRLIRSDACACPQEISKERLSQIAASIDALCRATIVEYTHIALHLILNLACEAVQVVPGRFVKVRLEEFEHYVAVEPGQELFKHIIDIIERLLGQTETKLSEPIVLDVPIKVAIANEMDLALTVNWISVRNRVEELLGEFNRCVDKYYRVRDDANSIRKFIAEELMPFIRSILATTEFPRCSVTPYVLESIVNELIQSQDVRLDLVEQLITRLRTVLELSKSVLDKIISDVARSQTC